MKKIVISLISWYRKTVSLDHGIFAGAFRGRCRFYPSCSEYAEHAVEKHGIVKGLLLAGARILRCNQLFEGGYDPVKG